ncbi:MAG TPA: sulfite reductase, partial [Agriterribacter sp.]|nr:sulfite reductase [Agriterribacter sp.]
MLVEHRLKAFQDLITQSSREELIWMNGFIAGLVTTESNGSGVPEGIKPASRVNRISILFGTETGNSKKVATDFATQAKKSGINVKLSAI